jgi:hypothetical protein
MGGLYHDEIRFHTEERRAMWTREEERKGGGTRSQEKPGLILWLRTISTVDSYSHGTGRKKAIIMIIRITVHRLDSGGERCTLWMAMVQGPYNIGRPYGFRP